MSTVISSPPISPPFRFTLHPDLVAKEPPERRGVARDAVRLMVIDRSDYTIESYILLWNRQIPSTWRFDGL